MLSEFPAPEVEFDGVGAEGETPAEAADHLARSLREWSAAHAECRILQLSVLPAAPPSGGQGFGAMAIVAYTRTGLTPADAAEAVAAAVVEIHEAQTGSEPEPPERL